MIAAVASIGLFTTSADAQRTMPRSSAQGWHSAPQGNWQAAPQVQHWNGGSQTQHWSAPRPGMGQMHQSRWGNKIGGHWYAGMNAPGGWGAYHRPTRGWRLPRYWFSPGFFIGDYASYGLSTPPYGYNWSRYYDDAVLLDDQGQVYDSVSGIDWDGGYDDDGYYADGGYDGAYAEGGQPGYAGYPDQGYYDDRRGNGVGGAIVGGVVGGVAGNVIAGRHHRVAGTLIGAGVGAAAGYAIDRNSDRGRYVAPPPRPGYGAPYPQPGGYYPQPAPRVAYAPPREVVQPTCCTTTTYSGGGYASGGYYYPPATTTTVTVETAPAVTTTTTEYVEETSSAVHRAWRPKKVWRRPAPRQCTCACTTTCR